MSSSTGLGEVVIHVQGLTVEFDGVTALENMNVDIRKGEMVGFIGPNGSGKSTLFNCITGQLRPSRGTAMVKGSDVTKLAPHIVARRGLARTFQDAHCFESLSVYDHLMVGAEQRSGWYLSRQDRARNDEAARELLEMTGLADKAAVPVKALSYGQKKLVGLASALMTKPSILLLDEPFSGVNELIIEAISGLILKVHGSWCETVLLVEHDLDALLKLCSERLVVLGDGRLVADGPSSEILAMKEVIDAYVGVE